MIRAAAYLAGVAIAFWTAMFLLLPWQAVVICMALGFLVVVGIALAGRSRIDLQQPSAEDFNEPADIWKGIDDAKEHHPVQRGSWAA